MRLASWAIIEVGMSETKMYCIHHVVENLKYNVIYSSNKFSYTVKFNLKLDHWSEQY